MADVWEDREAQRKVVVDAVRSRLEAKTVELKEQLRSLVDKIEVSDFQVNDKGNVTWSVRVPPTLLTLVHQLPDALSPPHDD